MKLDGTVLGFDVGARRIGVAVGSAFGSGARALAVIDVHAHGPDWNAIDRLRAEWRPDGLVVGDPMTMDGGDQPIRRRAHAFARELHGALSLAGGAGRRTRKFDRSRATLRRRPRRRPQEAPRRRRAGCRGRRGDRRTLARRAAGRDPRRRQLEMLPNGSTPTSQPRAEPPSDRRPGGCAGSPAPFPHARRPAAHGARAPARPRAELRRPPRRCLAAQHAGRTHGVHAVLRTFDAHALEFPASPRSASAPTC